MLDTCTREHLHCGVNTFTSREESPLPPSAAAKNDTMEPITVKLRAVKPNQ